MGRKKGQRFCGKNCVNAKSKICRCICGGENHGKDKKNTGDLDNDLEDIENIRDLEKDLKDLDIDEN